MSIQAVINYDDPANFDFDPLKIDFSAGSAKLKLVELLGQVYTEDFADDVGFTYDPAVSEFVAGSVRQKNMRPVDSTMGANFSIDENPNWGEGPLSSLLNGDAVIAGGKCVLISITDDDTNLDMDATGKINPIRGTIKFKYTPNYQDKPALNQTIFDFADFEGSNKNRLALIHDTAGAWRLHAWASGSGLVISNQGYGTTFLDKDEEIELAFSYDFTPAAEFQNVFVDGDPTSAGTNRACVRDNNLTSTTFIRFGGTAFNIAADFTIDDIVFYSEVKYTAAYVAGYIVRNNDYVGDVIKLPEFVYSGIGSVLAYLTFITTQVGNPRFTLANRYWSGAAWLPTDFTYAKSSTKADIVANIATLPADANCPVYIYFEDSAIQSSVSNLEKGYTGQIYPQDNPTVRCKVGIDATDVVGFIEKITELLAGQNIKYNFEWNNVFYHLIAGVITVGDGTYNDTNDSAEIIAALPIDVNPDAKFFLIMHLHVDDGLTTPEALSNTVDYNLAIIQDPLDVCNVYGTVTGQDGVPVEGARVVVIRKKGYLLDNRLVMKDVEFTTVANGEWIIPIVETETTLNTVDIFIYHPVVTEGVTPEIEKFKRLNIPANTEKKKFEDVVNDSV